MADNFEEFEQEMADVPNAHAEIPGMPFPPGLPEHLYEILQHFTADVYPYVSEAFNRGFDSVSFPLPRGCSINVRAGVYTLDIRFEIPPDLAMDIQRAVDEGL